MRYYLMLGASFVVLFSIDLFLSRLFMHTNISIVLSFLLTVAFFAPQKTRFFYRTLIPVAFVCGIVADGLSGLSPGIIFLSYVVLSIIVLEISKNIPSADSVWVLMLSVFTISLLFRLIIGLVSNQFVADVFLTIFYSSIVSAFYTTIGAAFFAFSFETSFGSAVGKIIFNSET